MTGFMLTTVAASLAASSSAVAESSTALASTIATAVPSMVASALPSAITTTQPVTTTMFAVPVAVEVAATFAGALAGALAGVRLRFDLVGIATMAVVSGLGGGIVRDVLLQDYGVYALENPRLLVAALVAAVIGFFFFSLAERLKWVLFVVDAIALGLFASVGSDKALLAGLTVIPAILLGSITAVGGGVLRDVLSGDVPQVLRPGGFYATVAVAGSMLYLALASWLNVVKPVAVLIVVLAVLGMRLATHLLGWRTPTATDLTPLVAAAPRRVMSTGGRAVGWARRASSRPGEVHASDCVEPVVPADADTISDGADDQHDYRS